MKLSKLLALLLAVLMIVSVLAACSSGSDNKGEEKQEETKEETSEETAEEEGGEEEAAEEETEEETASEEEEVEVSDLPIDPNKTTFTHWTGYSGADRPTLEKIWGAFNETDEIGQIQPSIMTWAILDQKMATAYASDTGPDTICGGTALRTNWYQGAGVDLTSAFDSGELSLDIFPESVLQDIVFDGGIWAVPMCVFGTVLYVDLDDMAAAGLEGAPASTEELIDYGRKMTIMGDDGVPTKYGLAIDSDLFWTYFIWEKGYDVVDLKQNGKATVNADGMAELLETVSGYVRDEQLCPVILDSTNMMINDKLSMYTGGPWFTTALSDGGVNFDVYQLPNPTSGLANHYIPCKWLLEGDENKFQAYINFCADWLEKDNQLEWCKGSGYPLIRVDQDPAELGDSWAAKFTASKEGRRFKAISQIPALHGVDGDTGLLAMAWQAACLGEITDYQAYLDNLATQIDAEVAAVDYQYAE